MYHSFLIHLSPDGHLGCFHVLAIVNSVWGDFLPSEPTGKPKNTGMGSLSLIQGIFPTQESNQGLLHYRWILFFFFSHNFFIYLFLSVLDLPCCMGLVVPQHVGSSQTGDWTCVPCIGRQILYHWATREALQVNSLPANLPGKPTKYILITNIY